MITRRIAGNTKGFSLIELLVVVAVIGILAAIAMPLYASMQVRGRIARAQSDIRNLATAIAAYSAHTGGTLPASLNDLTGKATSPTGLIAGPFMTTTGTPPSAAWVYTYAPDPNGTFSVQATGEGVTFSAP